MDQSITTLIIKTIVIQQKQIIGPLAVDQANKVPGVKISSDTTEITISGNSQDIIALLVKQYEHLFGRASIEACKDAIKSITPAIPSQELPSILQ